MRGTADEQAAHVLAKRFIPAHAGNGADRRFPKRASPVHPRACGERRRFKKVLIVRHGSSPRMRGTADRTCQSELQPRFIPAHAGNGTSLWPRAAHRSVHPRACGERRTGHANLSCNLGSSPRMRGTGRRYGLAQHIGRFIPAHAGNGTSLKPRKPNLTVHPRACGERSLI